VNYFPDFSTNLPMIKKRSFLLQET